MKNFPNINGKWVCAFLFPLCNLYQFNKINENPYNIILQMLLNWIYTTRVGIKHLLNQKYPAVYHKCTWVQWQHHKITHGSICPPFG